MAEAVDGPALQVVEVAFALMVSQPHAVAFGENQFRTVGDVEQSIDGVLAEFHFGYS
ncbi:hypothetical protein D3C81_2301930 [compost metagenome]